MNKQQMEMLSVKSAIERMVQGYINAFTSSNGSSKNFFDAVERLVASFFVGQQIDNNYLVRSLSNGDLEIRFTTQGHGAHITFMLPEVLRWKIDTRKPQVDENPKQEADCSISWNGAEVTWSTSPELQTGAIQYNTTDGSVLVWDGETWVGISPDVLRDVGADPKSIILEGTIRIGRAGGLEIYQNGKWVQLPNGHNIIAPPTPAEEPTPAVEEEFDPFEAYERAKKAVKNMV